MSSANRIARASLLASWQQLVRNASKLAFASGLRAAVVVCTPLLLSHWIGAGNAAWASLGGIETCISDPGGPYRRRLQTMCVLTVGGTLGCFIGTLAAAHIWTALLALAFWGFLWGLLRSLSETSAPASTLIVVLFLCSLGQPDPSLAVAVHRSLWLLSGCAMSVILAMGLWPFRPYAPARKAAAAVYREMGNFISEATTLSLASVYRRTSWQGMGQRFQSEIRVVIERARLALTEARAGRAGETRRGEQLTVLVESSDLLFGWCIGLSDLLEQLSSESADVLPILRLAIRHTGEVCFWIADALQSENSKLMRRLPQLLDGLSAVVDIFKQGRFDTSTEASRSARLLRSLVDGLRTVADTTRALLIGEPAAVGPALFTPVAPTLTSSRKALFEGWRERFDTDHNVLRYAVRLAVIPTIAQAIGAALGISHSYWLTFTAVIVMQPTAAATFTRGLQRVEGTILGGILAAVLASVVHSEFELAAALFPLSVLSLATLPLHYGAFAVFLTPMFVLLSVTHFGDWHLAGVRIADTAVGSVLGLLGAVLLWPTWERERFTSVMAECLRVNCKYLLLVDRAQRERGSVTPVEWVAARRATGLANNRADESLSRLLSEPRASGSLGEAAMAFVAYMRRLAQYGTAVATAGGLGTDGAGASLELGEVALRLQELADRLESGTGGQVSASEEPVSQLERQSLILHRSAEKMLAVLGSR